MRHDDALQPGNVLSLRWPSMRPTYVSEHPRNLDPHRFERDGIKAVIFDFDNTLISNHTDEIGDRGELLDRWIKVFGPDKVMIVSNKLRLFDMAHKLDKEAARFGIRALSTGLLIKPWPGSLKRAAAIMGVAPRHVLMVGDLLLADVLGGNLAGMKTLLIAPVHSAEGFGVRIIRFVERVVGYRTTDEHRRASKRRVVY